MKKASTWHRAILVLPMLVIGSVSTAAADPGLLLVAHGSPRPEWNEPVLDLGRRVAEEALKGGRFKVVRTAMLEAAQPNIPTAVAELEAAGCDRIVAVPLFIAPSGHSLYDVPAALGILSSPEMNASLAAEGLKAARPKVPVVLTQTLDEGHLLPDYACQQVRSLSRSPTDEAVVVLVHGDSEHQPHIDRLLRRVATRCCGETGIRDGDWAYVGVGQEYTTNGVAAIRAAAGRKPRVLVVGLYLSSTAKSFHERALQTWRQQQPGYDPFHGKDVVFSEAALVDQLGLVQWIIEAAKAALPDAPRNAGSPARATEHTP